MSLILDALRKSEAERQRGKSPDLFASTPGLPMPLRERLRLWPVLVFLVLLLASAWVIWRGESQRAESEAAAVAEVVPRAEDGVEVIDPVVDVPAAATAATQPPPGAVSPANPGVPTSQAASAGTSPPPARTTAPAPITTQPEPAIALPAPPPSPTAAGEPADESLPTVAILDAGTRASLPPLKLSMHVYGDDPAKRFAIVDGKRVGPGSLLGTGVVEAIRRDGVVVNINGQRLLLPKP